jgi:hypothetical protein
MLRSTVLKFLENHKIREGISWGSHPCAPRVKTFKPTPTFREGRETS